MNGPHYCANCGKALSADAKFCPSCGATIGKPNASPAGCINLLSLRFAIIASVVGIIVLIVLGWRPTSVGLNLGFLNVGLEPAQPAVPEVTPAAFETAPSAATPEAAQTSGSICPIRSNGVWLQYPNLWYGPFIDGDAILYSSAGGFSVWDADQINSFGGYGTVIPYPDPYFQIQRNQWIPLQQSHFSVCVDTQGNVFAIAE